MTLKQIQVLLLEDEASHVEAIRRGLESSDSTFHLQVVDTLKDKKSTKAKRKR